ncbi:hypothetical protein V6N13_128214 [Hibiscus sabdariffa]
MAPLCFHSACKFLSLGAFATPEQPLLGDWRGAGQLLFGGANVYVRRDTVSSKLQPHQNTTHEFESKQKAMDKVEVSRLKFGTTIANAIFLYFPY